MSEGAASGGPRQTADWCPEAYARDAGFVSRLGEPLIDLLAPRPGERVLDLGCGDGALSKRLLARGAHVVGVDASPAMVAAARAQGLDAREADGQALPFEDEFDAVFSNAAIHWMPSQNRVVAGVRRALKSHGRFVAEFGGAGNVAAIRSAAYAELEVRGIDPTTVDPWTFPTAEGFRDLLEGVGFTVASIGLFPRPTPLPGPLADWLGIFGVPFLEAVPKADRPGFLAAVERRAAPRLRDASGAWSADYVRLRLAARVA